MLALLPICCTSDSPLQCSFFLGLGLPGGCLVFVQGDMGASVRLWLETIHSLSGWGLPFLRHGLMAYFTFVKIIDFFARILTSFLTALLATAAFLLLA